MNEPFISPKKCAKSAEKCLIFAFIAQFLAVLRRVSQELLLIPKVLGARMVEKWGRGEGVCA
jgi:hypothetical protein